MPIRLLEGPPIRFLTGIMISMAAKLHFRLLAIGGFGLVSCAFAQIDGSRFSSDLRAKYGPPLARETFIARPGIEMIVDYAANGNVCRIQLPPAGPGREPGVEAVQVVDDFLAELVPLAMRGRELRRLYIAIGAPSMSSVEYENVTISESLQDRRRTRVTVTFKNEECQQQPRGSYFPSKP